MRYELYLSEGVGRRLQQANALAENFKKNPEQLEEFFKEVLVLIKKAKMCEINLIVNRAKDVYSAASMKELGRSKKFTKDPRLQTLLAEKCVYYDKLVRWCLEKRLALSDENRKRQKEHIRLYGALPYSLKKKMHAEYKKKLEDEILFKLGWKQGDETEQILRSVVSTMQDNPYVGYAIESQNLFKKLTDLIRPDLI